MMMYYAMAFPPQRMGTTGKVSVASHCCALVVVALACHYWLVAPACAQYPAAEVGDAEQIGRTTLSRGSVTGEVQGRNYPIRVGTTVYHQEWVTTRRESQAAMKFFDYSHLDVGPESRIRLDKVTTGEVALRVGNGSYKFIGGEHDYRSYKIRTPYAIVNIKGTVAEMVIHAHGPTPRPPKKKKTRRVHRR